MANINVLTMTGRFVNQPELRYTTQGVAVSNFTICTTEGFGEKEQTHFFDCVCWRHTAEFLSKYAQKGQGVTIMGRLQQNRWEDDKGKHSKVVISVSEAVLSPKGTNTNESGQSQATSQNTSSQGHAEQNGNMLGEEIIFDENQLPF